MGGELHSLLSEYVEDPQSYRRFDGLTWLFVREDATAVKGVVDWVLGCPLASIEASSLGDHWGSTDAYGHDAAGVFGNYRNTNCLLALGAILRRDVQEMMGDQHLCSVIRKKEVNRTGHTSAIYAAWKSDALVLKVSATDKSIKLYHKDALGGERVQLNSLQRRLTDLLASTVKH